MLTIISKKKFIFYNPDPSIDILKVNLDAPSTRNKAHFKNAIFTTSGDRELQAAPDWICSELGRDTTKNPGVNVDLNHRNILTFKAAVSDGDLYVVNVAGAAPVATSLAATASAQQAETRNAEKLTAELQAKREEDAAVEAKFLESMTKPQITDRAMELFDLKLDNAKTKAELIAAVSSYITEFGLPEDPNKERDAQGVVRV